MVKPLTMLMEIDIEKIMKPAYVIKSISIFLFIIFSLQVSDFTCVKDSPAFGFPAVQDGHQLKSVDFNKDLSSFPDAITGYCQCPCHLSFLQFPSTEILSYLQPGLPAIRASQLSIRKISTDIFQPPKILI
ncbi:MAG TPA: hypothetical protein DHU69_06815 [Deltaproteobacteria bacterium]|nr:MAG: hypothetical protein A2056_05665 [Deltaproteobacteria bacterium GWA2_42_85]OGP27576.1 MAG: hypothetical protein A2067_02135 [Deltaproteobacteria bacterium GWB2_42_7]OGP43852.1 MAG: hypothetical protein A2090_03005 [Deltaproteobacteria bacterium GWD2_42_10]OGP47849.1 MAG: hypothetical protein A2022_02980 [Deltaproteobacteria bacterium GWF2_42_12]OGQ28518.1 MAG: hypothetical protein A3D29_05140 [Deltaproteobacteria bacterium RIFCSPHIGHO2_02_FULL_42_44]OGQ38565.1 MAG: hypothetical protein